MRRVLIYALCGAGWIVWMTFFFGVPVGVMVWLMGTTDLFNYPTHALLTMLGSFAFMAAWAGMMVGIGEYVAEHYSEEAAFFLFMYHKRLPLSPPPLPPIPNRENG